MLQHVKLAVSQRRLALAVVRTDGAQMRLVPERGGGCNAASPWEGELRDLQLITAALWWTVAADANNIEVWNSAKFFTPWLCELQISDAVDNGKNQLAALGAATPLLANAMALSMPCREMCEAVMSSCSCGKEKSFGELLQTVIDDQNLVRCPGDRLTALRRHCLAWAMILPRLDREQKPDASSCVKPIPFLKLNCMVSAGK